MTKILGLRVRRGSPVPAEVANAGFQTFGTYPTIRVTSHAFRYLATMSENTRLGKSREGVQPHSPGCPARGGLRWVQSQQEPEPLEAASRPAESVWLFCTPLPGWESIIVGLPWVARGAPPR